MGSDKKKNITAGILMLVAAVWVYSAFSPSAPTVPSPTRKQNTAASLLKDDVSGAVGTSKHAKSSPPDGVDPTLRLDLLAKLQATNYEGSNRNIFQFYTPPPPPPPPTPVRPVETPGAASGPVTSAPPSPPPSIPLKFYGLASAPGVSPKKAFLQDGEEIFIALEGDLVKKRYRVVRINDNSIEMEDTQNSNKQRLPLQES